MDRKYSWLVPATLIAAGLLGRHGSSSSAVSVNRRHRQAGTKSDRNPANDKQTDQANSLSQQVEAARAKAAADGNYACCIEPACAWCLLHRGKCVCAIGVGSGKGACRECHGGWEAGQGRIPGRTKEDVRKMKTFAAASDQEGLTEREQTSDNGQANGRPNPALSGASLFQSNNCLSCHKMDGKGGTTGPDLTHEARHHADIAWQIRHLKDPSEVSPGSTMPSYAKLKPEELKALAAYLVTRK
jgi:cytochrome c2